MGSLFIHSPLRSLKTTVWRSARCYASASFRKSGGALGRVKTWKWRGQGHGSTEEDMITNVTPTTFIPSFSSRCCYSTSGPKSGGSAWPTSDGTVSISSGTGTATAPRLMVEEKKKKKKKKKTRIFLFCSSCR